MADTAQQSKEGKSLSQLIAGALMEISSETLKAVSEHPDSPELANRVKQVLGLDKPTDVMSPQEQLRYREAVEPETLPAAAVSSTTAATSASDAENLARLQAISDLAEEAQRRATASNTTTTNTQESMVEGLPKLLKKVIKQSLIQVETDIKAFKDKVSEDLQQRMK